MATGILIAARAALTQDMGSADGEENESVEKYERGHDTGGCKLRFKPYICLEAHLRPERIVETPPSERSVPSLSPVYLSAS
jgi:hypothetical protein